jgi:hypothetical protein
MRKSIVLSISTLLVPLSAHALVFGGSNLNFTGYPSHDCFKPTKPFKPYSLDTQWEVDSYNSSVNIYNSQLEQYLSCINEYIDNSNNDIKRIKEKAQEALDETEY